MNEQSWMERALGARGARALLAAVGTAILILSVPTTLIEHLSTVSGASDLLPNLAPPLGMRARIALAVLCALVAATIVWAVWGRRPAIKDNDSMTQAHKASSGFGWGVLVRLVRGETGPEAGAQQDLLSRRRRDRHPDAPPRPPLVASRDLPPPTTHGFEEAESADIVDEMAFHEALHAPLAAATSSAQFYDMPMPPRSPEPMSDDEIARTMAALASRRAEAFFETVASVPVARAAPAFAGESHCSVMARDLPLIEGADIAALSARFEQGLAKRDVVRHAELAQISFDQSLAFVQPDPAVRAALRALGPVEVVTATDETAEFLVEEETGLGMRVDEDVEAALNTALATLRKLTQAARR